MWWVRRRTIWLRSAEALLNNSTYSIPPKLYEKSLGEIPLKRNFLFAVVFLWRSLLLGSGHLDNLLSEIFVYHMRQHLCFSKNTEFVHISVLKISPAAIGAYPAAPAWRLFSPPMRNILEPDYDGNSFCLYI